MAGMLDPVILVAEIISAVLGWARVMFLAPLFPGAIAGVTGIFMAWSFWEKVAGPSVPVDIAARYFLGAIIYCVIWYWIVRGIRYVVDRRRLGVAAPPRD
jgi:hypothetical protein